MTAYSRAFQELVDFMTQKIKPEDILSYKPSASQQKRVEELISKERDGKVSEEEKAELDYYMLLEHVFTMAKAKARISSAK